jgi:FAD:protein FMN transferase
MITPEPASAISTFRAMGSDISVTVWGDGCQELASLAATRLEILEQAWSRFRPDSELSRANARAGMDAFTVSNDLAELVQRMLDSAELTHGLFNPTMARLIESLGYNLDFAQVVTSSIDSLPSVPSVNGIHLDGNQLILAPGVALDPGAIGKGLAGDILCREFMATGASGVVADIGGDVVAAGTPGDDTWRIAVVDETSPESCLATVSHQSGSFAVATSSVMRKRWAGVHHVIDPRTGTVSETDLIQATVVADSGWKAEALATAAMVLGHRDGEKFLNDMNIEHLLVSNQLVGSAA